MALGGSTDITGLLAAWRNGDAAALAELMPATYSHLKAVAARLLRRERPGQPFETTALVHETYLRLAELERLSWKDRAHFFAMSAKLMRQILIDVARARLRKKRSAPVVNLSIDELDANPDPVRSPSLLDLDDALRDLARADPERARIVELKFFGGMDREAIAEVMEISSATVSRRWRSARAWLLHYLADRLP